jgi:hypothetical protein
MHHLTECHLSDVTDLASQSMAGWDIWPFISTDLLDNENKGASEANILPLFLDAYLLLCT